MSAVPESPEIRFHRNTLRFSDLILDVVQRGTNGGHTSSITPLAVTLAKTGITVVTPRQAMESFIEKSISHWEKIRLKDLSFFRENASTVFGSLSSEYTSDFSKLFDVKIDGVLLVNDKVQDQMWSFFHLSVRQAISFIYFERKFDPAVGKFTQPYRPEVSMKKLAELWEIKEFK